MLPSTSPDIRPADSAPARGLRQLLAPLASWAAWGRLLRIGELPARGIHRIVLLRPNHRLGNTLMLVPLLSELERCYPGAEVDVVTGCEAASAIFAGFGQIRRIHQLTGRPGHRPLHLLRTVLAVRRCHYDLAIDGARGSRSGRLLLGMSGARHRLGLPSSVRELREGGAPWQLAMAQAPEHFALDGVHALRCALGCAFDAGAPPYPTLCMRLAAQERDAGKVVLANLLGADATGKRVVALFPHASGDKRLPGEWWQALVERPQAADPQLCFIEILAAHGRSLLGSRLPAFYSSDIRRMAAVLSQCDAYVSGDCGVMHLASAAGVPTLGLFARANVARYRPYGPHDEAWWVGSLDALGTAAATLAFLQRLPR